MGKSRWGRGGAPYPGALSGSSGRHPGSCSVLSWPWLAHRTAGSLSPVESGGGRAGHFRDTREEESDPRGRRSHKAPRGGGSLGRKEPGVGYQGCTFFRKKFLPDFLSPLLVRTPRWRMYRLMALTTAALWGGDGRRHLLPPRLSFCSIPTPAPQPPSAECLSPGERAGSRGWSQNAQAPSPSSLWPRKPNGPPASLLPSPLFLIGRDGVSVRRRKKLVTNPLSLGSFITQHKCPGCPSLQSRDRE